MELVSVCLEMRIFVRGQVSELARLRKTIYGRALVMKLVVSTVQNISKKFIISCRNFWIYVTVGVTVLTYYLEEIDER